MLPFTRSSSSNLTPCTRLDCSFSIYLILPSILSLHSLYISPLISKMALLYPDITANAPAGMRIPYNKIG